MVVLKILLAVLLILAAALTVPVRVYVRYTNEIFLQIRYLFLKFNIPITEEQKDSQNQKKKSREIKKHAANKFSENIEDKPKQENKPKKSEKAERPKRKKIQRLSG